MWAASRSDAERRWCRVVGDEHGRGEVSCEGGPGAPRRVGDEAVAASASSLGKSSRGACDDVEVVEDGARGEGERGLRGGGRRREELVGSRPGEVDGERVRRGGLAGPASPKLATSISM